MKIGNKKDFYFKGRERANTRDIIDKIVIIDEVHKFTSYDENKGDDVEKTIFTIKEDKEHFFYMPDHIGNKISVDDCEAINKGIETIKGKFSKVQTKKGFDYWVFEDVE